LKAEVGLYLIHPRIIIAFPLHQWLQERASMLRYMCMACFASFYGSKES